MVVVQLAHNAFQTDEINGSQQLRLRWVRSTDNEAACWTKPVSMEMSWRGVELHYQVRQLDFSEGFSLVLISDVFHFCQTIKSLTHRHYESETGTGWFSIRYSLGGPRFPNTSTVINVPILQQGHFLSKVFVFASGLFTFNSLCNACNFPRFQVLLRIP